MHVMQHFSYIILSRPNGYESTLYCLLEFKTPTAAAFEQRETLGYMQDFFFLINKQDIIEKCKEAQPK
jgi:hypothetical protein